MRKILGTAFFLGVLSAPCVFAAAGAAKKIAITLPDSHVVKAELALTDEEHERGLMNRYSLGDAEGMLFVFDKESRKYFWMKNTWIDLDIVYITAAKKVNNIFAKVPKSSRGMTDSQVASVAGTGMYVLELKSGAAKKHNIRLGSVLKFSLEPEKKAGKK